MYTESFRRQLVVNAAVKVVVKSIKMHFSLIYHPTGTLLPKRNILLLHDSRDGFDFSDIMY